jgi:hypothetical protein
MMIPILAAVLGAAIGAVVFFIARSPNADVNFFRGQNIMGTIHRMFGAPGLGIATGLVAAIVWWFILSQFMGARG